jgi:uncharacterized protein
MTTQEEQMLQGLTDRVNNTQLSEKDPEAEQFLQKTLGRNPDTLYILAQTLLVQQYALDQAQKQLSDARDQLAQLRQQQQPKPATSFLGNLLGRNNELSATPPPPPQSSQPPFTPVPNYPASTPSFGAPQFGAPPQSGGFLRSAMQTAAGVAAGALAFEGIESLMHGFGHSSGYSSGFGGFGESNRPEEVINNYYGDASPHEHAENAGHPSSDFEDHRDDSRLSDAVYHDDRSDSLTDKSDSDLTANHFAEDSADFDDSSDFDSSSNDDNSF